MTTTATAPVTAAPPQLAMVDQLSEKNFGDRIRFVQSELVDGTIDHIMKNGKRRYALITIDGIDHRLYLDTQVEVSPGAGRDDVELASMPPVDARLDKLTSPPADTSTIGSQEAASIRMCAGHLGARHVGHQVTLKVGSGDIAGTLEAVASSFMTRLTINGVAIAVAPETVVAITPQHPLSSRESLNVYYEAQKALRE